MWKGTNPSDVPPHFLFMKISNFSSSPALDGSQLPHSPITVMVYASIFLLINFTCQTLITCWFSPPTLYCDLGSTNGITNEKYSFSALGNVT
jgi:hypothetical protein